MKDIFIDSNIASRFCNPMDAEYKKLISWLLKYNKDKDEKMDCAYLVTSQKIVKEYKAANRENFSLTNISVVIDLLTKQGRINNISNQQIKEFQIAKFSSKVKKKLRSNKKDWQHIPAVLLSKRQYALAIDDNFGYDVLNFPGSKAIVSKRPENLPYDK